MERRYVEKYIAENNPEVYPYNNLNSLSPSGNYLEYQETATLFGYSITITYDFSNAEVDLSNNRRYYINSVTIN